MTRIYRRDAWPRENVTRFMLASLVAAFGTLDSSSKPNRFRIEVGTAANAALACGFTSHVNDHRVREPFRPRRVVQKRPNFIRGAMASDLSESATPKSRDEKY